MGLRYVCGTLRILLGLGLCFTGLGTSFAGDLDALKNAMDLAALARENALAAYNAAVIAAENASKDTTALAAALAEAQRNSTSAIATHNSSNVSLATRKSELSKATTIRSTFTPSAAAAARSLSLAEANVAKTAQTLALAQSDLSKAQTDLLTKTATQASAKTAADLAKAALAKNPKDRTLISKNTAAISALSAADKALAASRSKLTSATSKVNSATAATNAAVTQRNSAKAKSDAEAEKLATATAAYNSALGAFNSETVANKNALSDRNAALIAVSQANFNLVKGRTNATKAQMLVSSTLSAFGLADIAYIKAKNEYETAYDAQVATQLVFGSVPSTRVAGSSFPVSVTALNAKGKVATAYAETVSLLSSDENAELPAPITLTKGTGSFQVSLRSAGNANLTLESGDLSTTSNSIVVTPSIFSAETSVLAVLDSLVSGQSITLTLTLKDAYGNLAPSNAPAAAGVLFNSSLVGGTSTIGPVTSSGSGVYTSTLTGVKAGALVISASAAGTMINSTADVTVTPGPASSLAFEGIPQSVEAGSSFEISLNVLDLNGNIVTSSKGPISLTVTDAAAKVPSRPSLSSGTAPLSFSLLTAGQTKISATASGLSVESDEIAVYPAAVSSFLITDYLLSAFPGDPVMAKVLAYDAYSNLVTQSKESLKVTSTDPLMTFEGGTLSSGATDLTLYFNTPGTQTFSVSLGEASEVSAGIEISPRIPPSLVQISGGPQACSGLLVSDGTETGVIAPAHCISGVAAGELRAVFPDLSESRGVYSKVHSSYEAKMQGYDIAFIAFQAYSGTPIRIPTEFTDSSSVDHGFLFGWSLDEISDGNNVRNQEWTLLDSKTGTALFPTFEDAIHGVVDSNDPDFSLDGGAVLVRDETASTGYRALGHLFLSKGSRSLFIDYSSPEITSWIQSALSDPVSIELASVPSESVAGDAISFDVTALTANGTIARTFNSSFEVSSTDSRGTFETKLAFTEGSATFNGALVTSGDQTLRFIYGTVEATTTAIRILPSNYSAETSSFSFTSATVVSGSSIEATITPRDAFQNLSPQGIPDPSQIEITLSAGAGKGTMSDPILDQDGTYRISFTGTTAGLVTLSASMEGTLLTNTASVTVVPGPATSLVLTNLPSNATAGSPVNFTVTAFDSNANVATGFAGLVNFTSNDPTAVLPGASALTSGSRSFSATFRKSGSASLTVSSGSLLASGNSSVGPGVYVASMSTLSASAASVASGSSITLTLTTKDAFGNQNPTNLPATGSFAFTASTVGGSGTFGSVISAGSGVYTTTFTGTAAGAVTVSARISGSQVNNSVNLTVNHGPASRIVFNSPPASAVSGTSFSLSYSYKDAFGNNATSHSITPTLSSTDPAALNPAGSTSLASGSGTFTVTLRTASSVTLTASGTGVSSATTAITVNPGAATKLVFKSPPTNATAGTAFSTTVEAQDANNNRVTSATHSITCTSSDAQAVLPAAAALVSGQISRSFTLKTAGSRTITAAATGLTSATATLTVSAGSATQLAFTLVPGSATAGTSFNATVIAKDAFNNTATAFAGSVSITSSDAAATLPAASTLASGSKAFAVTLKTAGSRTITASSTGLTSATSNAITVSAAAVSKIAFTTVPTTAISGTAFTATVAAQDAFNNQVTSYVTSTSISTTDAAATPPAAAAMVSGTRSFSVTLKTAGSFTITATSGAYTVTSPAITVSPGAATKLVFKTVPTTATAGTSFSATVEAQDANNNRVTSATNSVTYSSSDAQAVLPASAALVSGQSAPSLTLRTAGSRTITAAATGLASATATLTVSAGSATQLVLSGVPASVTAGGAFTASVTALDAFGNTATSHSSSTSFVLSDGASPPAPANLSGGTGSFSITFTGSGSRTFTATSGALSVTSTSVTVNPGAVSLTQSTLSVSSSSVVSAESITVTLTTRDAYGNTNPSGVGAVAFTTSANGGSGSFGSIANSGSGVYSSSFTGILAGSVVLGATIGGSTVTSTRTITVNPGAASQLVLSGVPSSASAGNSFKVTVTAKDSNGNVATSHTATTSFTLSDGASPPAAAALSSGVGTFSITFRGAGVRTFSATSGSLSVSSGPIQILPGALGTLILSGYSTSITAGDSISMNVEAYDSFSNLATNSSSPLSITSSDPGVNLEGISLSEGRASFNAILSTPGTHTITVLADGVQASSEEILVQSLATPTPIPGALVQISGGVETCAGALVQYESEIGVLAPAHCVAESAAKDLVVLYADLTTGIPLSVNVNPNFDSKTLGYDLAYLPMDGAYTSAISFPSETHDSTKVMKGFVFGWKDSTPSDGFNFTTVPAGIQDPSTGGRILESFDPNFNLSIRLTESISLNGGVFLIPDEKASTKYLLSGVQSFTQDSESILSDASGSTSAKWLTEAFNTPASFNLIASSVTPSAGDLISITVEARTASGRLATEYQGTLTLVTSDTNAAVPASVDVSGGVGSFEVSFRTAGLQSVTLTDNRVTSSSPDITVSPGPATFSSAILASKSESVSAGSEVSLTLSVFDAFGNAAPLDLPDASDLGFFTLAQDAKGTFDSPKHQGDGVYTVNFTGMLSGELTIGVSHPALGEFPNPISMNILPGAPSAINVESAPISVTAGEDFGIQLSLVDSFGNIAIGESGTSLALFGNEGSSCDSSRVSGGLSGSTSGKFIAGVSIIDTVQAISTSIRSLEIVSGSISTCISGLGVAPGRIQTIAFSTEPSPRSISIGAPFTIQPVLTGYDAYSNPVTNDTETVVLLSAIDGLNCSGKTLAGGLGGSSGIPFDGGIATFRDVFIKDGSVKSILAVAGSASACFSELTLGSPPVARDLSAATTFASSARPNLIQLSYSDPDGDLATECAIDQLVNVTEDYGCSCNKGVCSVSILGDIGPVSGSFEFTVTAGGSISNRAKASIAIYPGTTFAFSPTSRYYGWVGVGETGAGLDFTITNSGSTQAINCSAPTLESNDHFLIVSDTCGTSNLAAGSSCLVKVAPRPGSAASLATTLSRECLNVPNSSKSTASNGLSVTGKALAPAITTHAATSVDFGQVRVGGNSYTREVMFTNTGFGSASCSSPVLSNSTDFTVLSDGCGSGTLSKGGGCSVTFRANPASTGSKTATLSRTCGSSTASISLSASGSVTSDAVPVQIGNGAGLNSTSGLYKGFTCVLMSNGTIQCWGDNLWGQLGNGTTTASLTPVTVTGITNATALATGNYHNCALLADTTVKCWGPNTTGQSGHPTVNTTAIVSTPYTVSNSAGVLKNIVAISAGFASTCAIRSDATVWCWGYNFYGQLGNATGTNSYLAVQVLGITTAKTDSPLALSVGNHHACVVLANGSAQCWGYNTNKQLGNNTTVNSSRSVAVLGLSGAVGVSAAAANTCFLKNNSTIQCLGNRSYGSTGDGTISGTPNGSLTQVTGITNATSVIAGKGGYTFCAILADKSVRCWGRNFYGLLSNGLDTDASTPITPQGISDVTSLSMAENFGCALDSSKKIECWGNSENGETGLGTVAKTTLPKTGSMLSGLGPVQSVASGNAFTCALLASGSVKCWGSASATNPSLGDNSTVQKIVNPVTVLGITNASSLAVGDRNACVIVSGGIKCWGTGSNGANGDGTITARPAPVTVTGITTATQIGLGRFFGCALLSNQTVKCWGLGNNGQQGHGALTNQNAPSATALNVSGAIRISAGYNHACALLSSGQVMCWGSSSYGQIGNGTSGGTTFISTPAYVTGINTAMEISTGYEFSCALLRDNTVRCWGYNNYGTLGDGAVTARSTPVTVTISEGNEPLTRMTSITSNANVTCGNRANSDGNQLVCWGNNAHGSLGLGIIANTYRRAVEVPGMNSVAKITAGPVGESICTIDSSGTPKCFGNNDYNRTGDNLLTPVSPSGF
jgi:alpha-tubulin suppressor-like RCC1 family protein